MNRIFVICAFSVFLAINVLQAGEIRVTGQGQTIPDGSSSPDTSDGTDFGTIAAGAMVGVTQTFVIRNDGATALQFANVSVSGAAFAVIGSHPAVLMAPGATKSFQIEFDPVSAGTKNGTVTILNNDSNEGVYTFAVTGESLGTPEIIVRGRPNTFQPYISILDGDTSAGSSDGTAFGNRSVDAGASTRTFQIENDGDGQLDIDSITEGSLHFSVGSVPSVVGVNQTQTFTVSFNPTSSGAKETTVTIQNNDPNEDPFTFKVSGTGLAQELRITGQGLNINNGDTTPRAADGTDFGTVAAGDLSVTANTFVLRNDGNTDLHVSAVIDDGAAFSITGAPGAATPIPPGGSDNFTIHFDPVSAGTKTATVQVRSDDPDDDPYTFEVTGVALGSPDIAVRGRQNPAFPWVEILNGDPSPNVQDGSDFGSTDVGAGTVTRRFQVRNTGEAQLTINSITDSSPHFAVAGVPSAVGVNQTQTFDVIFDPNASGQKDATVTLRSDDPADDPYTFIITGFGLAPELRVTGQGLNINNDDSTPRAADGTDFGTVAAGDLSVTNNTFAIHNDGNIDLHVSAINENGAAFSVSGAPGAVPIPPGGSDNFTIHFDPVSAGTKTATIQVRSDDPDDDPYRFDVTGEALGSSDIILRGRQNAASPWVEILNGAPSPSVLDGSDFGSADVGGGLVTHSFQVGNNGEAQLTILSITEGSPHFSVSGVPAVVGVNQSQTIDVTFDPNVAGQLDTTIIVRSDDPADDPYSINITGLGLAPQVRVTGQGTVIDNGDTTPRAADGTDFGTVAAGDLTVTDQTFVIHNDGNTDLHVSAINENGAAFSVTGAPGAVPIPPSGSDNFIVHFDPVAAGTKTATIQVRSDDPTGDPYVFNVTGEALGTQEMVIFGRQLPSDPWVAIQNGAVTAGPTDGTSFGPTEVNGGAVPLDFGIENTGFATLNISSIVSDSPHFAVSAVPGVVGVNGGMQSFKITFDPEAGVLGALTATITVRSDDPDDDPFTFTVIGTAMAPKLVVEAKLKSNIPGPLDPVDDESRKITGLNDLAHRALRGTGCLLQELNPWDHDNPCWDAGDPFGLRPDPSASDWLYYPGPNNSGLPFLNNPEIAAGDMTPSEEDFTDFGSHSQFSGFPASVFGVVNRGNRDLNLLGITTTQGFLAQTYRLPLTMPPGSATPFNVILLDRSSVPVSGVVTLLTDDPVNPVFSFAVAGDVLPVPDPGNGVPAVSLIEVKVDSAIGRETLINGQSVAAAGPRAEFEPVGVAGQADTKIYWIVNRGDAPLSVSNIGANDAQFSVSANISSVGAGGRAAFEVQFDPASAGIHEGVITVTSDALDHPTFAIPVVGEGLTISPAEPEIALSGMGGLPIAFGQTPLLADGTDLGRVGLGETISQIYTVRNTGDAPLTISNAAMLGAPSAVGGLATTIPPGGSDDFSVTLTATVVGRQYRPLVIGSDDPDTPAFLFWITALVSVAPEVVDYGSSGDDFVISFKSDPAATYRITSNTDLSNTWIPVAGLTGLVGSSTAQQVVVPDGATSLRRFFRVEEE